jgi:glycerol dehydrogenase-like iron-containing ADH family enzyme
MTFNAQGFNVTYGNNIAANAINALGDYVLVTQPEPWAVIEKSITNKPLQVIQSGDLSPETLDRFAEESPKVTIVGLGGGSAMDTSKWIHWRRSLPLLCVTAAVSDTRAMRCLKWSMSISNYSAQLQNQW